MEEMQRLVEETIQHFGGLDVIISNAVCSCPAPICREPILVIQPCHS